jgi:hypothetical protein
MWMRIRYTILRVLARDGRELQGLTTESQRTQRKHMLTFNVSSFFSLCLLCALCDSVVNSSPAAEPRWLGDWEEGRKAARDSGKPLFVVFRCQH